jgi:methionyl-tRNA formyltransferase
MKFIFFGTPDIAVASLNALHEAGLDPEIIVTQPDRPAGRGQILTPPPVKVWADAHGITTIQTDVVDESLIETLSRSRWDCFVLVAFGVILPQALLDIPRKGVVNVHPSLLPKLRGPSPIRTAILTDARDAVGVTVMLIDHKMDHGPIIAQEKYETDAWPVYGRILDEQLANLGGTLLARVLPKYVNEEIIPYEQNHKEATFTKYLEKIHAEINLGDTAHTNLLKICAYDGWPSAFTYVEKNGQKVRLKIISAHIENDVLVLDRVIPEGKKEMNYSDFMRV